MSKVQPMTHGTDDIYIPIPSRVIVDFPSSGHLILCDATSRYKITSILRTTGDIEETLPFLQPAHHIAVKKTINYVKNNTFDFYQNLRKLFLHPNPLITIPFNAELNADPKYLGNFSVFQFFEELLSIFHHQVN